MIDVKTYWTKTHGIEKYKIISFEEAIKAYRDGREIGIVTGVDVNGRTEAFLLNKSVFQCSLSDLVDKEWIVKK